MEKLILKVDLTNDICVLVVDWLSTGPIIEADIQNFGSYRHQPFFKNTTTDKWPMKKKKKLIEVTFSAGISHF